MPANIYHNNGNLNVFVDRKRLKPNLGPVWCRLLEGRMMREPGLKGTLRKPANLDIVLCTTQTARQYTERILEHLGIRDFSVLGRDLDHWRHIYKLKLILEYIRKNPKPEILLHLDAPDVLLTGELQPAVDQFLSLDSCDLLFGAEKNSAPGSQATRNISPSERQFISRIEHFEESTYPAPFQHLNAGLFIGKKESMLNLLETAMQSRLNWRLEGRLHHGDFLYEDDQLVMREMHRQCFPRIQVDHGCQVFQNLYATHRREIASPTPLPGGIQFLAAYLGYLKDILARRTITTVSGT